MGDREYTKFKYKVMFGMLASSPSPLPLSPLCPPSESCHTFQLICIFVTQSIRLTKEFKGAHHKTSVFTRCGGTAAGQSVTKCPIYKGIEGCSSQNINFYTLRWHCGLPIGRQLGPSVWARLLLLTAPCVIVCTPSHRMYVY